MNNKTVEQIAEIMDQTVYSGKENLSDKQDIKELINCFDRWKEELMFQIDELDKDVKEVKKIAKSEDKKRFFVEMYTDGSSLGNPGNGGWGTIIKFNDKEIELKGNEKETTNNRMELMAVIKGLEKLKKSCHIRLCSDSKYVLQGIDEWLPNWISNDWKGSNNKPIKNIDLWKEFVKLSEIHSIEVEWVKGHNGHPENERCDTLAREAAEEL